MAFKSFTCVGDTFAETVPPEGWSASGDALYVANNTDTLPLFYMSCDPELSHFPGAAPVDGSMTAEQFHDFWPLLVGLLVVAFGVKYLLRIFLDRRDISDPD